MRERALWAVGLIGMLGAVVGCGSSDDTATVATRPTSPPAPTTAPTRSTSTTVVATSTSTTVVATSTTVVTTAAAPSTTAAPATVAPAAASTGAPTSTTGDAAPPDGWQPAELTPAVTPVGYSGNWAGVPSPAAPADGGDLADGYYSAALTEPWDPAAPGVLHAELRRFGRCSDLPADACTPNPDDPDELGIDPAWSRPVDIPLDATTRVVVAGFACGPDVKSASGADLAELFAAFDAAYGELIAPQVLAGVQDLEIAESFGGETMQGFVADQTLCPEQHAGVLHFQHGDSPSLLLQVLLRYTAAGPPELLRSSDVAVLNGVDVRDGAPTYYFVAGFAS